MWICLPHAGGRGMQEEGTHSNGLVIDAFRKENQQLADDLNNRAYG